MFRRIELIQDNYKGGIASPSESENDIQSFFLWFDLFLTWCDKIKGNAGSIPKNSRFFFTEKGWEKVGRHIVVECKKRNIQFRILKFKESHVNIVWKSELEVAVQYKKK